MKVFATIAALAAVSLQASAAVEVVSAESWTLYRGAAIVQPRVTYASKAACEAAAPIDLQHRCVGTETFIRRPDAPPPTPTCTTPQPAAQTRTQECPAGTSGTWTQASIYTAAAYPTCWQAGPWAPADAPAGACTPVVEPPPVGAGESKPQGLAQVDVVTSPVQGTKRTFHLRTEAELLAYPWGQMQPGDAVNVYYSATPFKVKIGLRAQCTAANPCVINGVTDASGKRPVFDFKDARTASGSANVFSSTLAYGESLGGIVIKRGPSDDYFGAKPSFISLRNLEVRGAANGNGYTSTGGARGSFSDAGNIYIHVGSDITIDNVISTDAAFCLFTMAKDGLLSQAGERITLRNSRMYGCGVVGAYYQHNVYMQSASPVVEGNYFGKVRAGSQGSSYKSRSSGELFRNNVVIASARAIDFVHAEEQEQGIAALPDYGTDYVTGNTIVSDGPEAIHYGGDNLGEQDGGALFVPTKPYRKALYFWNNTVTLDGGSAWRINVFDLSLRDTTAYVWGNTFNLSGGAAGGEFSWLQWAGQLKLGTNTVNGIQPAKARSDANGAAYNVTTGNAPPATPYEN